MGSSGYTCVRHVFCWLNLILWVSGALLLTGGVLLRVYYPGQSSIVPHLSGGGLDTFMIVVGSISIVLTFLGCCGACVQSKCLLVTYFSFLVIILCTEFVVASLTYVYREPVSRHVRAQLTQGIERHYNYTDNNLVPIWDHLQKKLQCCGVDSYKDYFQIEAWPEKRMVPDSCCKTDYLAVGCGSEFIENNDNWWSEGCANKVSLWLIERLHYASVIGCIVAFIQLFGLISSLMLCCTVKHKRESRSSYQSYQPAS